MCKTPPVIDEKLIIETMQEYSRRKGIFLKKKEAKMIMVNFKKKYGRLPTFKEIWNISEKIIDQKTTGKKLVIKPDKVDEAISKKMEEMKKKALSKKERKEELKKKLVAEKETVSSEEENIITCQKCGFNNPPDSKFCLECGNKLK
ncbi:MAG: zinc ribbon domain-containing protein [Promethearchaeota archaeon]